jgi:hypothetical protein
MINISQITYKKLSTVWIYLICWQFLTFLLSDSVGTLKPNALEVHIQIFLIYSIPILTIFIYKLYKILKDEKKT